MTGTTNNLQNVISEAKLALLEFDREQEGGSEIMNDTDKRQTSDQNPSAPLNSLEGEDKTAGLTTPPTRHAKSPSVT